MAHKNDSPWSAEVEWSFTLLLRAALNAVTGVPIPVQGEVVTCFGPFDNSRKVRVQSGRSKQKDCTAASLYKAACMMQDFSEVVAERGFTALAADWVRMVSPTAVEYGAQVRALLAAVPEARNPENYRATVRIMRDEQCIVCFSLVPGRTMAYWADAVTKDGETRYVRLDRKPNGGWHIDSQAPIRALAWALKQVARAAADPNMSEEDVIHLRATVCGAAPKGSKQGLPMGDPWEDTAAAMLRQAAPCWTERETRTTDLLNERIAAGIAQWDASVAAQAEHDARMAEKWGE